MNEFHEQWRLIIDEETNFFRHEHPDADAHSIAHMVIGSLASQLLDARQKINEEHLN